jgi:hypothetical protein
MVSMIETVSSLISTATGASYAQLGTYLGHAVIESSPKRRGLWPLSIVKAIIGDVEPRGRCPGSVIVSSGLNARACFDQSGSGEGRVLRTFGQGTPWRDCWLTVILERRIVQFLPWRLAIMSV